MRSSARAAVAFFFVIGFVLLYYFWLVIWAHNDHLSTWGGDILSVVGSLIAALWLARAARRTSGEKKAFWSLLSAGCFNYVIAEVIWLYEEKIQGIDPPSPGWTDLFYMLQVLCYLIAFVYPFIRLKKSLSAFKLIFDIWIVMVVAATFSWHYLISPILNSGEASLLTLTVALAYPITDLALLFGALSLYGGSRNMLPKRSNLLIFLGLVTQAGVDSVYLYLLSTGKYVSGSLVDPLFMLSLLLVGYAGFRQQPEDQLAIPSTNSITDEASQEVPRLDMPRLLLPYVTVIILFLFMISSSAGMDAFTLGTGLSILLLIVRQLFTIWENQQLMLDIHRKSRALEISEERYKSLFDYHPDAVYSLDLNGHFDSANAACSELLEYEHEELIGQSLKTFVEDNRHAENAPILFRTGRSQRYETLVRSRNGRRSIVSVTHVPIRVGGEIVGTFGIGRDITENKRNEERIRYLAYHDALTGLLNRAAFDEQLKQTIAEADSSGESFAVVFIDLDRFKNVNDTLGHDVGDRLLVSVATRLRTAVEADDVVARQGGDEFTLILRGVEDREQLRGKMQHILETLSPAYSVDGYDILALPSMGLAVYPVDDLTASGLTKKADIALYKVKYSGKGHFRMYCETSSAFSRKFALERDLDQALAHNQLFLHYQPQIDSDTQRINGVEALLRWNHPKFGPVTPAEFIPIAEESGQILEIGRWVLEEACVQAKSWQDLDIPLKVGVNLSPVQLHHPDIVEQVRDVLRKTGLSPQLLDLEITETAALQKPEQVKERLHQLKQLGLTLSIDDFGTGYSSLSQLETFPIDKLKIARQFTHKLEDRQVNRRIVSHIVDLAKTLEMSVIAEGVESEAQAAILRDIECVEMQGFLFGRPVSAAEIGQMLLNN
ncbi:PAS domain S-box protein [Saccharibacillus sp. O16]|nr:PAS domain S-box protein [Saccharibacillus sp. O16]